MQKYDWLRLFSEVRPTFLPYARFSLRTYLSPEQCRERLSAVTQPQKLPTLFSAPTSPDARLLFKGKVSEAGFLAVPLARVPVGKQYRNTKPFYLIGNIESQLGRTALIVRVFPDPLGLFILIGILLVFAFAMGVSWSLSLQEKFIFEPVLLARVLLVYAGLTLPAAFEAYQARKILERLLPND